VVRSITEKIHSEFVLEFENRIIQWSWIGIISHNGQTRNKIAQKTSFFDFWFIEERNQLDEHEAKRSETQVVKDKQVIAQLTRC